MREILFRGKAINRNPNYEYRTNYKNGDWVYGLLTELYDERFENIPAKMTNTDGISDIDIDYKTVGQFTGLTDKNGKKIFEGDILKGVSKWLDKPMNGFVAYKNGVFGFIWYRGFTSFSSVHQMNYEIIGNIHDNPELLRAPQNDEVRE